MSEALEGMACSGDESVGFNECVEQSGAYRFLEGFEEGVDLGPVWRDEAKSGVYGGGFAEINGGFNFLNVDAFVVPGPSDRGDHKGVKAILVCECFGLPHESEFALVEVLIAKVDQRGAGPKMFVQQGKGFGAEGLIDGTVNEGDLAVLELLEGFRREVVLICEQGKLLTGKEGEVAELFWVTGNEGSFGAIKDGNRGCEITLSGLVDDGEVEKLGLKREDAMEIIGRGDPNRENPEERFRVKAVESFFLSGSIDTLQTVPVSGECFGGALCA